MDKKEYLINKSDKETINIIDVMNIYYFGNSMKIKNGKIVFWSDENEKSEPTESELESHIEGLKNEWDSLAYARNRKPEYPALKDQLDLMYHDLESWKSTILAIKTKYPKTE